ncbi:MAG: hypothetical protein IKR70_06270, partial [Lachnospiraceae bacterium]|nr:hypothetical protein [Lachnospiraceae bacterium]
EPKTYFKLFLVSLLMMASFFAMLTISSFFLFIAVLSIFLLFRVLDWTRLEYEYTLTNGDIQIAKIAAAKKRKEVMTINLSDMKSLENKSSGKVQNDLRRTGNFEIFDFTEQVKGAEYYALYVKTTKNDRIVILDLDENSLEHMKLFMKSKFNAKIIPDKKTELNGETE